MKKRLMRRNGLTAGNARCPKHGRKSNRSVEETRNRVHLLKRRAAKQENRQERTDALLAQTSRKLPIHVLRAQKFATVENLRRGASLSWQTGDHIPERRFGW